MFAANGQPVNTSVSAVFFCKHLKPFTLHSAKVSIWHNPFARNPIEPGIFPFDEFVYSGNENVWLRRQVKTGINMLDLLGFDGAEYMQGFVMKNRRRPDEHA